MNKIFKPLLFTTLIASSFSTLAYDSYFEYEHTYGSRSHYHGDNFGLHVDFDQQAYVGIKISLYNQEKNKIFLDNIVSDYYEMYAGYNFKLSEQLTLTPNFAMRFYSGGGYKKDLTENQPAYQVGDVSDSQRPGSRYTPGLKLNWQANELLDIYGQYSYEYRKVTRSNRDNAKYQGYVANTVRNRFDIGAKYVLLDNLTLGYQISYLKGNYILQNDKKHDYQQEINLNWQALSDWRFNFGAEDVARSTTSGSREAKLKLGVTYSF